MSSEQGDPIYDGRPRNRNASGKIGKASPAAYTL